MIKIQLQHGGNPYIRGNSWKEKGQNGTGEDKSSKRVENTNESQRCRKLPWICKLLLMLYSKLQPYSKTTKQAKRQEGLKMERRTPESI